MQLIGNSKSRSGDSYPFSVQTPQEKLPDSPDGLLVVYFVSTIISWFDIPRRRSRPQSSGKTKVGPEKATAGQHHRLASQVDAASCLWDRLRGQSIEPGMAEVWCQPSMLR